MHSLAMAWGRLRTRNSKLQEVYSTMEEHRALQTEPQSLQKSHASLLRWTSNARSLYSVFVFTKSVLFLQNVFYRTCVLLFRVFLRQKGW